MKARLLEYLTQVERFSDKNMNEATTKNVLVEPFLMALGYDPKNPLEVALEFTADVGIKKGEKADYAILKDGEPIIIIEAKPVGTELDSQKFSQLYRYYMTLPEVKIAILTNGIKFLIFSDTENENVLDTSPFLELDFTGEYERWLPELIKLAKDQWDLDGVLSTAESLKHLKDLQKAFTKELNEPSEDFCRLFINKVYDGPITAKVREKLYPLVSRAIRETMGELTRQRLRTAIEREDAQDENLKDLPITEPDNGIITTDQERTGHMIIRAILQPVADPEMVVMRDAKSYCSILFDDNNRKPICRLFFDRDPMSVVLFDLDKSERVYIDDLNGLYSLTKRIRNTIKKYL